MTGLDARRSSVVPRSASARGLRAHHAVALYVVVRLVGVLVLAAAASRQQRDALRILTAWDAQWYAGIAADGYGFTRLHPDGRLLSDYAFFPLLPLLERAVAQASGLSFTDAGLLVSAVAGPLAAWGIFRVVADVADRRTALLAVALWASLPIAVVQTMAYTESLLTALAAWSLHAAQRGRWLAAGSLAAAAALTRPTGVAVVAALVAAVLVELRAHRRREASLGWRSWLAVLVALAGSAAYPAWVAVRTGSPDGYLDVTAGWGNTMDGGVAFGSWVLDQLTGPSYASGIALTVGVATVALLFVAAVRDRVPVPLLVYAAVILALTIGTSGYFGSKPRYLLPAFVLLLPLAARLSAARRRWQVLAVLLSATVSWAYGAWWLLGSGPP